MRIDICSTKMQFQLYKDDVPELLRREPEYPAWL